MSTIYLTNGKAPVTSDGKLIVDCCCGHSACVCASIMVFYNYQMIGSGDEDPNGTGTSVTHYCTPAISTKFTKFRDMQTLTETRKGSWSWLDGGSCNYYQNDNRWKNLCLNGTPSGSGSSWSYQLHAGRAVNEGKFQMFRVHMLNPASSQGAAPKIREVFELYINLLLPGKVTWTAERGEANGSCSSFEYSLSQASTGVFNSSTWGAADSWALQPNYSAMQITGGWYLKSIEFNNGYSFRKPWTTRFTFKVEAL